MTQRVGFNFSVSRGQVDWKQIDDLDVDRLIRNQDIELLNSHISNVTNCNLLNDYYNNIKVLDNNFIKLFRLAQLSVEFLLHCKISLEKSVDEFEKNVSVLNQDIERLSKECLEKKLAIKNLKRKVKGNMIEIRNLRSLLYQMQEQQFNDIVGNQVNQRLIYNSRTFPCSQIPSSAPNLTFLKRTSHFDEVQNVESQCEICGKVFMSKMYLYNHIVRRHPNDMSQDDVKEYNNNMNGANIINDSDNFYKVLLENEKRNHYQQHESLQMEIKQLKERVNFAESQLKISSSTAGVSYGYIDKNQNESTEQMLESGEIPTVPRIYKEKLNDDVDDKKNKYISSGGKFSEDVQSVRYMLHNEIKKLKEFNSGSSLQTQIQSSNKNVNNIVSSVKKDASVNTDNYQVLINQNKAENSINEINHVRLRNDESVSNDNPVNKDVMYEHSSGFSTSVEGRIVDNVKSSQKDVIHHDDHVNDELSVLSNSNKEVDEELCSSSTSVKELQEEDSVVDVSNNPEVNKNHDLVTVKKSEKKLQPKLLGRMNESEAGILLMRHRKVKDTKIDNKLIKNDHKNEVNQLIEPKQITTTKTKTVENVQNLLTPSISGNESNKDILEINSISSIEDLSIQTNLPKNQNEPQKLLTNQNEFVKKRNTLKQQKSVWNDNDENVIVVNKDKKLEEEINETKTDKLLETPVILITEHETVIESVTSNSSDSEIPITLKSKNMGEKNNKYLLSVSSNLRKRDQTSSNSSSSNDISSDSISYFNNEEKSGKENLKKISTSNDNDRGQNYNDSFEFNHDDLRNDVVDIGTNNENTFKSDISLSSATSSPLQSTKQISSKNNVICSNSNKIITVGGESEITVSSGDSETDDEDTEQNDDYSDDKEAVVSIPSVKKLLESNPEIFDSLRQDLQSLLDRRLRDLGVDPEWTSLPNKTFSSKMTVLKHHMKITAKRYKSYYTLQKQIEEELDAYYCKKYGFKNSQLEQKSNEFDRQENLYYVNETDGVHKEPLSPIPRKTISKNDSSVVISKYKPQSTTNVMFNKHDTDLTSESSAIKSNNDYHVTSSSDKRNNKDTSSSSMLLDIESDVDDGNDMLTMYNNQRKSNYLSESESTVTNTSHTFSLDYNKSSGDMYSSTNLKLTPIYNKGALKQSTSTSSGGNKKKRVLFLDEALVSTT